MGVDPTGAIGEDRPLERILDFTESRHQTRSVLIIWGGVRTLGTSRLAHSHALADGRSTGRF